MCLHINGSQALWKQTENFIVLQKKTCQFFLRKEKYYKAAKIFTNPALKKCMEAYTTP
jgi:transposase-like protein